MDLVPYSFAIFTATGIWRPLQWTSGLKKYLYNCYTSIVLVILYLFAFMQFVDTVKNFGDLEQMVSASFMLLTAANTFCKAVNVLSRRNDIINIFGILNEDLCQRRNVQEEQIQAKISARIRNNVLWYCTMVLCAISMITMSSVIKNVPERTLPFKAWIPFNYTSDGAYWSLWYYQVIAHGAVAVIASAYDILIPGIMLLTGGQLQILKFRCEHFLEDVREEQRITEWPNVDVERKLLKQSTGHHRSIVQFAMSLNDTFSTVIFIQYAVSSVVICISVYRLSGIAIDSPEFPFALVYFLCMINQILCYCWYGNEVILESSGISEAIYKMDWLSLHPTTQKDLIMIMQRSNYPIVFTSGKLVKLSLQSFTAILKLSYTAFNVLQQK